MRSSTEPDVPVVSDPMSVLESVEDAVANELVLRLLEHDARPDPQRRRAGAATKVGGGHFGAADLGVRLEAAIGGCPAAGTGPERVLRRAGRPGLRAAA